MTPTTIFGRTAFLAAALGLFLTAASEAKAACDDPAAPEVDWSKCHESSADLTNATLTDADLSGATWTDGRVCAEGSLGACN